MWRLTRKKMGVRFWQRRMWSLKRLALKEDCIRTVGKWFEDISGISETSCFLGSQMQKCNFWGEPPSHLLPGELTFQYSFDYAQIFRGPWAMTQGGFSTAPAGGKIQNYSYNAGCSGIENIIQKLWNHAGFYTKGRVGKPGRLTPRSQCATVRVKPKVQ